MQEYVERRPALAGVLLATVVALGSRLIWLGERTMHFDEARVAFRILEYGESGSWTYNAIVHGPFLFHIDQLLFSVLGPTDFIARLPVALVGGLLPATAWLFRERLDTTEVVALAAFLAANPVLLYYSRFMRNDVLVAAFAFAAFGFGVRLLDTGKVRYLYAGALTLALAFTAKENALLYVGMWIGALILMLDYRLLRARISETSPTEMLGNGLRSATEGLRDWSGPIARAVLVFILVIVVFYAPRPTFSRAVTNPSLVPTVLEKATLGAWTEFFQTWGTGASQDHAYLPFLRHYLRTLRVAALPLVALAGLGFVVDRYAGERATPLITAAGVWAGASLLIYPLVTDIQAPWSAVHTIVPAALPAAVGAGLLVDEVRDALTQDDAVGAALAGLVILAVVGQVMISAVSLVYLSPQSDTQIVQFGQPADDLDPALDTIETAIAGNGGTDVFFVGLKFNNDYGSLKFDRLPWPWYLKAMGASVNGSATLGQIRYGTPAPVIIVPGDAPYVGGYTESDVRPFLEEYTRIGSYAITLNITGNVVHTVVYVRTDVLAEQRGDLDLDTAETVLSRDLEWLGRMNAYVYPLPTADYHTNE